MMEISRWKRRCISALDTILGGKIAARYANKVKESDYLIKL
jgi:hypothetical protein